MIKGTRSGDVEESYCQKGSSFDKSCKGDAKPLIPVSKQSDYDSKD